MIFIGILDIIYITLTKLRYITDITYRSSANTYRNITIYYRPEDNILIHQLAKNLKLF